MIITISGTMGSGKSTLAKKLAQELNFEYFGMGQIFRDLAKKKNLTLREYVELGETDPQIDKEVDDYQLGIAKTKDNFIIDGRISFFLIPDSIKLYLFSDPEIGARRIFADLQKNSQRNEGVFQTVAEVKQDLEKRMATDKIRYKKYYNIDVYNQNNFDLALDTSALSEIEVFDFVYNYIKSRKKI